MTSRWRPPKPPDEVGTARAGPSASGATLTAPDEKGGRHSPPPPPRLRPTAEEWLPPLDFLPPGTTAPEPSGWVPWTPSQGMPPRPRHSYDGPRPGSWDPQRTLDDLTAALAADRVYDSMDDLAAAFHARLATLTDMPAFRTWERSNPAFKPLLSGFLWTAHGPRRVTVLLDTGATHCFICTRLATALGLQREFHCLATQAAGHGRLQKGHIVQHTLSPTAEQ